MRINLRRLVLILVPVAINLQAADYYVSPTGKDSNPGTLLKPWLTLNASVNKLAPGDTLILEAGAVFSENLYISKGGTEARPITIKSDPNNRAHLIPPKHDKEGIMIWNTAGVVIENLLLTGPGTTVSTKLGVAAMADNGQYKLLKFVNIEISQFYAGLGIYGWGGTLHGFSNIVIEDCYFHRNLDNGGSTWAEYIGGIGDIAVRRSVFAHNYGDPQLNRNSGSGFAFGGVNGGLIEHCIAHHNGGDGNANEGPVGIWAYDSTKVTIQFCESYANKAKNMDGGGFDFDQNVTDSVIQYCYSHDNYGAGYLMCHAGNGTWNDNTLRYCISENDGYGGKMGAIHFYSATSGLKNLKIYGNTIFSNTAPAVWIQSIKNTTGGLIANNIFQTASGKPLVRGSATPAVLNFQQNCYWSSGAAFSVAGYNSLEEWRAARGQEMSNNNALGLQADPQLVAPGMLGKIHDTSKLNLIEAYRLKASSPCLNQGLDLKALFNLSIGTRDFWGTSLPQGTALEIGAYEMVVAPPPIDSLPPLVSLKELRLEGKAAPNIVIIYVNDIKTDPDPQGNWSHVINVSGNSGKVVLEVVDRYGQKMQQTLQWTLP